MESNRNKVEFREYSAVQLQFSSIPVILLVLFLQQLIPFEQLLNRQHESEL